MTATVLLGAYFLLLVVLALLGVHRFLLVAAYLRSRSRTPGQPPTPAAWPGVTIQLPIYNEPEVVERLLSAVADLDYPHEQLEVQVLDDSTDGTGDRIAASLQLLRQRGVSVRHLRRRRRSGYKAGALAAGLRQTDNELVCVFDADFVPPRDFLRRTVPYFAEPELGMVQVRWGHLNRGQSLLTHIQAMLLDAHFAVEQAARCRNGFFFNFNGTAGIWRRAAIEAAGGWEQDTLTEDLDLSYRAQLAGWRFLYIDAPETPAELPITVTALKSQQHRWTKGAVQTARKLLGRVWRSELPWRVKLEASCHLTANVAYPVMAGVSFLVVPTMLVRHAGGYGLATLVDVAVLLLATGSVALFFSVAQAAVGQSVLAALLRLPALMALGIGLSVNNARAVFQGLSGGRGEFVRTPKPVRLEGGVRQQVTPGRFVGWQVALEAVLALYFAAATVVAWNLGMWGFMPFVLLFQSGYTWVAMGSLTEWFRRRRLEVVTVRAVT